MPHTRGVASPHPRLAEALAALSLAGDLGMGFALEHALRVTYLAGRIAIALGLDAAARHNVFHVALVHGVGCTADAHDLARVFQTDEIALKHAGATLDEADRPAALRMVVTRAGSGGPIIGRPGAIVRSLAHGDRAFADGLRAHCEVGELLVERVGVPAAAREGLLALFERWDGRGVRGLVGDEIPLAARVFHAAKTAVAHHDEYGIEPAVAAVRHQSGRAIDPRLAEALLDIAAGESALEALGGSDLWERALEMEPASLRLALDPEREARLFGAMADVADLKSPVFVGHSRRVAALASEASRRLGFKAVEAEGLGRCALAHDLGRVTIPNSILDRAGPLNASDWEVVRLHAYHTERILLRSTRLAPHAAAAGLHHERLDGSGYHRGVRSGSLPPTSRVLAAADVLAALTAPRPHRPAHERGAATALLRDEVRAGRLDGDAVDAVVATFDGAPLRHLRPGRRLTAREVEVVTALASGLSTRDAAAHLGITEKTLRHHVEHVYDKLGVSTRAAAVAAALGDGRLGEG